MTILVTGGAGFIGSHTAVVLRAHGYPLVIVDNLANSAREAVDRAGELSGSALPFYQLDINDAAALRQVFAAHSIQAVIHFAGLKAVGESATKPVAYYRTNVAGTLTLLEVMAEFGVKQMVFSSSATVYGDPAQVPIPETASRQATNPYGRSKLMVEEILADWVAAVSGASATLLRYFNPVGAHPSGRIGEDPQGIPNNLVPFVAQVATGRLPHVKVFGNDYPTPDGTGVRDYIHVMDLAEGHASALAHLQRAEPGLHCFNLGTGRGYSVLEVIEAFRQISGRPIPTVMAPRRPGDIATCYADPKRATEVLGWRATHGLETMLEHVWQWQQANPNGYRTATR